MPKQGLHLIPPTSTTVSGGGSQTATINTNGSVTFSGVYGLKLSGVFTNIYDNYQIVCRTTRSGGNTAIYAYMLNGTTRDTSSNYNFELLQIDGTSYQGSRTTSTTETVLGYSSTTRPHGFVCFIYGPYLSQPTVGRSLAVDSTSNARIYEAAWSHNVSSSFDGIELYFNNTAGQTSEGLVCVYGMRK